MKSIYLLPIIFTGFLFLHSLAQNTIAETISGKNLEKATFAGGCFWCMEKPFESMKGVMSVTSGYSGGYSENPNYENYSAGNHLEVIEVVYDSELVSYEQLLEVFWRQVDPTDPGGQFGDRGKAYSTAIYFHDENQKKLAELSKSELDKKGVFDKPIVTPILSVKIFYPAEEYHQDYYKNNPLRYKWYRSGSGRDQFLQRVWNGQPVQEKTSEQDLRHKLTPLQYYVTQEEGTEEPYNNEYWNNKKAGIYVDVVSGEVLFSSIDKYDSKTGWPSFSRPLEPGNIEEKVDSKLFMTRTEVRSKDAGSHLGHVFEDGPEPSGLRYCINSVALRFVPKQEMEQEGYGKYLKLFDK